MQAALKKDDKEWKRILEYCPIFAGEYSCHTLLYKWPVCGFHDLFVVIVNIPDGKVHGVNMGPTWVLSVPDGPHVGPMNLAIRDTLHHWKTLECVALLLTRRQYTAFVLYKYFVKQIINIITLYQTEVGVTNIVLCWNRCELSAIV